MTISICPWWREGPLRFSLNHLEGEPVLPAYILTRSAPCILLNIYNSSIIELVWVAISGAIVQIWMLAFSASTVCYHSLKNPFREGECRQGLGIPMMCVGTGLLILGMIICSYIVGSNSDESKILLLPDHTIHLIWVQQNHKVSDEAFNSFLLLPGSKGYQNETERGWIISFHRTDSKIIADRNDKVDPKEKASSNGRSNRKPSPPYQNITISGWYFRE